MQQWNPKPKKCKQCGGEFIPVKPLQSVCGFNCAIERAYDFKKKNLQSESRKETKEWKNALLTRNDYIKTLQIVFNTFIRLRDKLLPCISCGTVSDVRYDAGHFYPTTYGFLRFNEDNVHRQCSNNCNLKKSGNFAEYRIGLIKRIGRERVQWLEDNRHQKLDLSVSEIKEKIVYYKQEIKKLR